MERSYSSYSYTTHVTCITETDNTFVTELESFKLSTNEQVMSPPTHISSPLINHATRHPPDNQQIHFSTTDPEDDLPVGDQDQRYSSDVSMNYSHWTVASANNAVTLLSPSVPLSPDSEPASLSSSDYCVETLFNDDFNGSGTSHTEPCPSISSINKPTTKSKNRFYFPRFWTCNLRGGFCSKVDEITEVIVSNQIDIAILTETWLHVNIPDSLAIIPGYDIYRKDRSDGRSGGGILVYVKHGVPCHLLPQINKADIEVLWLLYRRPCMPREVSHILIGAVYHPPKANNQHMIEHLISSMDTISRQHPYTGIMILGDFNQLPDGQLCTYPLRQLVTGPTRKSAILDKIYSNIGDWFEASVVLPAITKSDHDSVIIVPSQQSPLRPRRQTIDVYCRSSDPNK